MKTFVPVPSAIDAILFDLDGTVVNTIAHILASFRHATADILGESLPDAELMHHVGIPLAQQMRLFTGDERVVESLLLSYREYNQRTHDEMAQLYPNTKSTLQVLHGAGLPMGIVTSKSRVMADRAIELFDLEQYFRVVVTADDTVAHKPDPLPVVTGAEALGCSPLRAAYVGDSPMDIEAGNNAGAYTIAAAWGVASRERLEGASPGAMINDIAELPVLLGIIS